MQFGNSNEKRTSQVDASHEFNKFSDKNILVVHVKEVVFVLNNMSNAKNISADKTILNFQCGRSLETILKNFILIIFLEKGNEANESVGIHLE